MPNEPTWDETSDASEPSWDETSGVSTLPNIPISPYEKYRLEGREPVSGPFGPAHPEEVPALVEAAQTSFLPESKSKGLLPAAYNTLVRPIVSPLGLAMGPAMAGSVPLRIAAGIGFGGMAAKSGLEKMGSEDPQTQLEGRLELAGAPILALAGGEGVKTPKVARTIPEGIPEIPKATPDVLPKESPPAVAPEAVSEPPIRLSGEKKTAPWPSALINKDPSGEGWRLTWFSEFEGKLDPRGHDTFPTRDAALSAAKDMDFTVKETTPSGVSGESLQQAPSGVGGLTVPASGKPIDSVWKDNTKRFLEEGYEDASLGGIERINVSDIAPSEEHGYAPKDLVDHIKKGGALKPVVLERYSDGSIHIVDGSNRVNAALEVGVNDIPAKFVEYTDGKSFTTKAPPTAVTGEVRQPAPSVGAAKVEVGTEPPTPQVPTVTPPVTEGPKGELQMTVLPGAKEFAEQDLVPFAKESADTVSETAKQVKSLLAPPSMGETAELAGGIIRERKAELARKDVQAREQFAKAKASMDRLSKPASLDFINRVELGQTQATPELNSLQASLRSEFNKRVREVHALGTGKLQHVLQDYFPHIWKDPESAVSWYSRILGKRPLRGPGAFLKERTIPTTADGVAAGLEPVSFNPIDLSLLKFHEMDRYVMGQKIFSEFKDKGLTEFSRSDIPPKGYAKIDDRIANVVEYRPTTRADGTPGAPERIIRGHYYAPEDAARMINNFLSPGLDRYKWFRSIRWVGNTMNLAQLGLSGYHFLFTMIDSSTSKLALGLEQIARGDIGKGAQNVGRGVAGIPGINQLEYFLKGNKVLKEYTKPGSVGGDYAKIVDGLMAAGGRTEMPQIFKNNSLENFMTALRSGNYPGAVIRAPFAAIQAVSHPLMMEVVPRLKLGAFTDMARYEIEKMGPNVTRDEVRKNLGKIWDSVDNRMGEMVYDNLFWNRTLKDLSFLTVRAVGWNLGTIRELGGGMVDSAKIISRLRSGEPIMTRRMAYVMALPITVGTMGAMYQYMKTGKGPEDLRDYFYPKTGKTLPDGTPERVNFPSYLKDIVAYKMHPLRTLTNKLHPMWSEMSQMLENKDYYGAQIRNPDDPLVKQVQQEMEFVVKTFVPFSVRGAERRVGAKESPEIKAESFMGIMPISPEIARTPAQNRIIEFAREKSPKGGHTPEEQARKEFTRDIESQLQSPKDYQKIQQDMVKSMREGKLTRGQMIYQQSKLNFERQQMDSGKSKADTQWMWRFRHLNPQQASVIYELSTPAEKKLFNRDYQLKLRKAQ